MIMLQGMVKSPLGHARRGREVRKPARYCLAVEGPTFQGEGNLQKLVLEELHHTHLGTV